MKTFLYWSWVENEAKAIKSDGCTGVTELFKPCCLQHDLGYYYAKDPKVAYTKWLELAIEDPWGEAPLVTRADIDAQFRECIQTRSKAKRFSPIAWLRYAGVRIGGLFAWNKHRNREKGK